MSSIFFNKTAALRELDECRMQMEPRVINGKTVLAPVSQEVMKKVQAIRKRIDLHWKSFDEDQQALCNLILRKIKIFSSDMATLEAALKANCEALAQKKGTPGQLDFDEIDQIFGNIVDISKCLRSSKDVRTNPANKHYFKMAKKLRTYFDSKKAIIDSYSRVATLANECRKLSRLDQDKFVKILEQLDKELLIHDGFFDGLEGPGKYSKADFAQVFDRLREEVVAAAKRCKFNLDALMAPIKAKSDPIRAANKRRGEIYGVKKELFTLLNYLKEFGQKLSALDPKSGISQELAQGRETLNKINEEYGQISEKVAKLNLIPLPPEQKDIEYFSRVAGKVLTLIDQITQKIEELEINLSEAVPAPVAAIVEKKGPVLWGANNVIGQAVVNAHMKAYRKSVDATIATVHALYQRVANLSLCGKGKKSLVPVQAALPAPVQAAAPAPVQPVVLAAVGGVNELRTDFVKTLRALQEIIDGLNEPDVSINKFNAAIEEFNEERKLAEKLTQEFDRLNRLGLIDANSLGGFQRASAAVQKRLDEISNKIVELRPLVFRL